MCSSNKQPQRVCPKTGKPIGKQFQYRWLKWLFPLTGIGALVWFLIRVIPKPSRAEYPCQKVAFPIASSFIAYILGLGAVTIAMKKAILVSILFLYAILFICSECFAVTVYVSTTGNNANSYAQAQSKSMPWRDLDYALEHATTGDTIEILISPHTDASGYIYLDANVSGETYTIQGEDGGNATIRGDNSSLSFRVNTCDGATFVFNNITFDAASTMTSGALIWQSVNVSNNYYFNNCTLGCSNAKHQYLIFVQTDTGANTSEFIFNNCIFTGTCRANVFRFQGIEKLEITSSTFTNLITDSDKIGGDGAVIKPDSNMQFNKCFITDNTMTLPAKIFLELTDVNDISQLVVTGNTVVGSATFIQNNKTQVTFSNISNNFITTSHAGLAVIYWGISHPDIAINADANAIPGTIMTGNTIIKTGTTGHAVHLGMNTRGCYVANNFISSTTRNNWGLVDKGLYNTIENNVVIAGTALYLVGSQFCKIVNNTFVSNQAGGAAVEVSNAYGRNPLGNSMLNNIFYTSNGAYAVNMDDADFDLFLDNYFDYNCYYGGTNGTFRINATNYNTITELQTAWPSLSEAYSTNDAHSIIADPEFVNTESNDYRLLSSSPCINGGARMPGSWYQSIGASKVCKLNYEGLQTIAEHWLTPQTEAQFGDLYDDNQVNFKDFAVLAADWAK